MITTHNVELRGEPLERPVRRKELSMQHLLLPKTLELAKEFLRLAEQIAADFDVKSDDARRLDWLEKRANEPGGLLLHDGSERGRCGLGLRPGNDCRDLRQAIDHASDIETHNAL